MKFFKIFLLVVIANTFCNSQTITTIADTGEASFGGDANAAVAAQLYFPTV